METPKVWRDADMPFDAIRRLGSLNALNQLGLPIAVDFGVSSLKVLQIAKGDPPTLQAAASIETPENLVNDPLGRLDFQTENLARLVRTGGFKGKRVVCSIPSSFSTCKHIRLAKIEGLPLSGQVAGVLGQQLNVAPSSLVFRTIEVGDVDRVGTNGGRQCEVICMASSREGVGRLMDAIKAAKLEPVGVHSEFIATLRAFGDLTRGHHPGARPGGADQERTTLYLDVGTGSTRVMIAHGDRMAFARVLQIGGRALDEAIASTRNLSLVEAHRERYAMAGALPERGQVAELGANARVRAVASIADASLDEPTGLTGVVESATAPGVGPDDDTLRETLEILTDEILMCLRYHESLFPSRRVDGLVFVGGEARHMGLCQHIARTLRLPAQVADPLARVARTGKEPANGINLREPQPGWTVPLGLCLCPTDL